MRALRDFNIPKITAADTDIFFGLLGDLFPAIHVERKRDMDFEAIIEQTCVDNKLYPEPDFIMKIV
jgi:dynein heavy chain